MTAAPFRIYNTLSRSVEPFVPQQDGHVSLYVCGMTVYDHAHVGHARAMVAFDAFVRWLRFRGWQVTFARNFTDVDDKIIRRAAEKNVDPLELAEHYIQAFHDDCDALGLARPDLEPRVSTSMDAIIAMIQSLVDKGHAYESGGSVWFSVSTYADYGQLSGQKPDEMMSSPDTGHKRASQDFALWKAAKPGEPSWPSPWGEGRPGWHIECSAMTCTHLGSTIDIHGGGLDLVFPHHENEIAQSTCANAAPYARYWMHNGLLTMASADAGSSGCAKMGKSAGNAFNIRDALAQYPAEALRLYYLQALYRSSLPWDGCSLTDSLASLARLYEAIEVASDMQGSESANDVAADLGPDAQEVLQLGRSFAERFTAALDDDFNTAQGMGYAFELARAINRFANHKKANKRGAPVVAPALKALATLQAIGILTMSPDAFQEEVKTKRLAALGVSRADVQSLLDERVAARTNKDWARADEIRHELDDKGIVVMDRPSGVTWRVRL